MCFGSLCFLSLCVLCLCPMGHIAWFKQGVAITGRNRTGPPWSVSRLTAHAPSGRRADRPHARRPARPPAGSVTDDRRWQTTTTDRHQPSLLVCPPYTKCRRASNKWMNEYIMNCLWRLCLTDVPVEEWMERGKCQQVLSWLREKKVQHWSTLCPDFVRQLRPRHQNLLWRYPGFCSFFSSDDLLSVTVVGPILLIIPLQTGDRRRRSDLGLVCFVNLVSFLLLS